MTLEQLGGTEMRKTKGISQIITYHYNMPIDEVVKETKQRMLSLLMSEVVNEIGFDIEAKIKVHYHINYLLDGITCSKRDYEEAISKMKLNVYHPLPQQKHIIECEYIVKDTVFPSVTPLEELFE